MDQSNFAGAKQNETQNPSNRRTPKTELERKKDSCRHSKNYKLRIKNEIAFFETNIEAEKLIFAEKSKLADDLSSSRLENEVRATLNTTEMILKNIGITLNWEEVEKFFQTYRERKKLIPFIKFAEVDPLLYEEFIYYQEKFDHLMKSKPNHVKERGQNNFAAAKQRLSQRLLRAKLGKDYHSSYNCLMSLEGRIKTWKSLDEEFKSVIFIIIQKVDEVLKTSRILEENWDVFADWESIKEFYQNKTDNKLVPSSSGELKEFGEAGINANMNRDSRTFGDAQSETTPSTSSQTSENSATAIESEDLEDAPIFDEWSQNFASSSQNEHEKTFFDFFN